jgi:hypothetical protein
MDEMSKAAMLVLTAVLAARAQMPEFYRHVDRVLVVVDDIDRSLAVWRKIGIIEARPANDEIRPGVRWAVARLGDTVVDLIQPVGSDSPFAEFRRKHGQGVFALLHRVATERQLEVETARLKTLGTGVLDNCQIAGGAAHYVLFDTEAQGKYVLGLIRAGEGEYSGLLAAPPAAPNARRVSQYAFVARDLPAVSRYWAGLGFPAMSFTHPTLWDQIYHGQPGNFDADLGWQKHGRVEYEWIQPTKGPTTYLDHMSKYGEGVHHIAFAVPDIDREERDWSQAGFPTTQSGAWGERDQPGYGRYAYQDVHAIAGIEVELLWNYHQ